MANTTNSEEEEKSVELYVSVVIFVTGTVILCENSFLLVILSKSHKTTSRYFFTASLAVTDLCTGIDLPIGAVFYLPAVSQHVGIKSVGSTLFIIVLTQMTMLSIMHMAVIAVERYLYMVRPFFHERHLTLGVIRLVIAAIWILGTCFIISLAALQGFDVRMNSLQQWNQSVKYSCLATYVCLTIVSVVCYTLVLVNVKKKRRTLNCGGSAAPAAAASAATAGTTTTNVCVPRWRENLKCLKFFMSVFGAYFLMTCSAFIWNNMPDLEKDSLSGVRRVLYTLSASNSGMNFLILMVVDREFRHIAKTTIVRLVPVFQDAHNNRTGYKYDNSNSRRSNNTTNNKVFKSGLAGTSEKGI